VAGDRAEPAAAGTRLSGPWRVGGAVGRAGSDQLARAEPAADQATRHGELVAALAEVGLAVASLAHDRPGLAADPARARWPLVARGAAWPVAGRGRDRRDTAAAAALSGGVGVAADPQRPAVGGPGRDRPDGVAAPAGLERGRVTTPTARADRAALCVAEGDRGGLPAAAARGLKVAAQALVADPPAGHQQRQLPPGDAALHAAGPCHPRDPGCVQLPQPRSSASGPVDAPLLSASGWLASQSASCSRSRTRLAARTVSPTTSSASTTPSVAVTACKIRPSARAPRQAGQVPVVPGWPCGSAGQPLTAGGGWQPAQIIPAGLQ
jgi:hypothetical protein